MVSLSIGKVYVPAPWGSEFKMEKKPSARFGDKTYNVYVMNKVQPAPGPDRLNYYIYTSGEDSYTFTIDQSVDVKVIDQILSTFKFTE